MIKYIAEIIARLTGMKAGMEKNAAVWQNQTETPAKVQEKIDLLNATETSLEKMKEELGTKQAEAHTICDECSDYANRLESIAIGLEGSSVEKLNPYGISLRKASEKKAAPYKTLLPHLEDDTDGIGFIVSTQSDPDALHYEWQKGIAADASKTDVIPEMKFLTITTKSSFVDDDVPKGVRVFYRVRAVNRSGYGPWSEAVSKVQ